MKLLKSNISLFIIAMLCISCSTETPSTVVKPVPDNQIVLQVGAEVDAKFVQNFEPKPKAGAKVTFISSSPGIETREASTEIVAIDGEILTVRFIRPEGTMELKGKNEDFKDDLPKSGIKYEGTEDVKVPAGDYKAATKVSFTNTDGTKVILWLVKDVGPVKRIDTLKDSRVVTTELKEFKY